MNLYVVTASNVRKIGLRLYCCDVCWTCVSTNLKGMIYMYFPSKRDLPYTLLFWMPILLVVFVVVSNLEMYSRSFMNDLNVFGYFVAALPIVLISLYGWIWLGTGYKIEEGDIKVTSGPFKKRIKIKEINKLGTSKITFVAITPLSGPALSTERIEMSYGKHNDVINVSPSSRKHFIDMLLVENPEIQIEANVWYS